MKLGKNVKYDIKYELLDNVGEMVSFALNKEINNSLWELVRILMITTINPRINEIR